MPNIWVLVKIIPEGTEGRGKTELEKRQQAQDEGS